MTNKPFTGLHREKLIIALQMHDIVGAINLAMRVRKAFFILDYSEVFPKLLLGMPGLELETIMRLDPRKHCCYISMPRQRELFFLMTDIHERLIKLEGRLSLTGDKPRQGPKRCLLQVYVAGADKIALTLMETTKGKTKTDVAFQTPDGETP